MSFFHFLNLININLLVCNQDLMLSLWTLLNEQGLNENGDTPDPPKLSPALEEIVAVGAEPHTWGLILQEATPLEALREHTVPKNTSKKRGSSSGCKHNALEDSAPRQLTLHVQFTSPSTFQVWLITHSPPQPSCHWHGLSLYSSARACSSFCQNQKHATRCFNPFSSAQT